MRRGLLNLATLTGILVLASGCERDIEDPQAPNLDAVAEVSSEVQSSEDEPDQRRYDDMGNLIVPLDCDRNRWVGNKWWAESESCTEKEDLRVFLYVESVDLGFDVSVSIQPASCLYHGQKEFRGFRIEDASFFRLSDDKQNAWFENGVRRLIDNLDPACGGPYDPAQVLTPRFKQDFDEIAERYWRGYDASFMARQLRQREEPT